MVNKWGNSFKDIIQDMLDSGDSANNIASKLGVHHMYVNRAIRRYKLETYVAFDEEGGKSQEPLLYALADCAHEDYWEEITREAFIEGSAIIQRERCNTLERQYLKDNYGGIYGYLAAKGMRRIRFDLKVECLKCKEVRSIVSFSARSSTLLGLSNVCRGCESMRRQAASKYYSRFPDKTRGIRRGRDIASLTEDVRRISGGTIEVVGNYVYSTLKIQFLHTTCGNYFYSTPGNVLHGSGCPRCRISKGEHRVRTVLKKIGVVFEEQFKIEGCRYKRPLPFDFRVIVGALDVLIEYDGAQHSTVVEYWGGVDRLNYIKRNDRIKTEYCRTNGIPLIRIDYTQFDEIEAILTRELTKLGVTGKRPTEEIAA